MRFLVVSLLVVAACDATPPSTHERPPAPPEAKRNLALGTGEVRAPEPFTRTQRLLDAVSRGDRPTIERALGRGATLAVKDDLGRSPVLLATLDAGDLELVRWLHAEGATLDEPDAGGRTALSFAAAVGRLDIVRFLIENGAAVDRPDMQQRTPLFHAALGDHAEVAAFLLDRRAAPDALIVACAKGNTTTAALLLRRGADAGIEDQEGRTARERSAPEAAVCRAPAPG
jgi:hypothetical protein